jgi:hypothetical protein
MIELKPNVFMLLTRSTNVDTYNQNIRVLSNTKYIQNLYKQSHCGSFEEFLNSTENIPRALESYLVIDFERKRTLICEFLFTIHMEYPRIFTLERYLYTTRCIFWIITQYRWSREDISFILKKIIIHLDVHSKNISREYLISLIKRFYSYEKWKDPELKCLITDPSYLKLVEKNLKQQILKNIRTRRALLTSRFKKVLMKFGFMRKLMIQN